MKKIIQVYNLIKEWVEKNGIEGILGLIIGLILWVLNYKIIAGFSLGIFATRNLDILKEWVKKVLNK